MDHGDILAELKAAQEAREAAREHLLAVIREALDSDMNVAHLSDEEESEPSGFYIAHVDGWDFELTLAVI